MLKFEKVYFKEILLITKIFRSRNDETIKCLNI